MPMQKTKNRGEERAISLKITYLPYKWILCHHHVGILLKEGSERDLGKNQPSSYPLFYYSDFIEEDRVVDIVEGTD